MAQKTKYCLCFLFFLSITVHAAAQKKNELQHFTTKNGLSHLRITDIFQDSRGYIWLGTYNGLNKFDGTTFTIYYDDKKRPDGINSNDIYKITEDKSGRLWVGTNTGISLYNRSLDNFRNYTFVQGKYFMCPVRCIIETKNKDELLLGTSGGLFLFNVAKESYTHLDISGKGNAPVSIIELCYDSNELLWIAAEGGLLFLMKYKDNKLLPYEHATQTIKSLGANKIVKIIEDKNKTLWLGGSDGMLHKFNRSTLNFEKFRVPIESDSWIAELIDTKSEKLYIGTEKHGVYLFDKQREKFSFLDYKSVPGNKMILSLFEDKNANIWIGTQNSGLYLFDELDSRFKFIATTEDINIALESNSIISICEDNQGNTWMGTDGGGIIRYNKDFSHYTIYNKNHSANLPVNTALSLLHSSDDKIYIGTYLDGLYIYNPKNNTYKKYLFNPQDNNGISDDIIWSIYEDNQQQIWIATNIGGLVKFNPKNETFIRYMNNLSDTNSISSNSVRTIYQDSNGQLWIGTVYGLNRFNHETNNFSRYFYNTTKNSLSNNNILCTHEGAGNLLYIGTLSGGLNVLDMNESKFIHYTMDNGLLSNIIYGILEDEQGSIWISTDKGISQFLPSQKKFINFTSDNGLFSTKYNFGAYYKNSDGKLFFGSINGACYFEPYRVKLNQYIPPVYLTDFILSNNVVKSKNQFHLKKSIAETDTINLHYSQNFITFKYAALNFTHATSNEYAYKLAPIEESWNNAGNIKSATYANLEPGEYTFMVKGSNNDGIWNTEPAKLIIIISPPFWKTLWFKILISSIILSIISFWYKNLKEKKMILEQLVKERTSELEEKNKRILETEKENYQLIQQKLNYELETKSKELSRTVLIIIQKNRLLEELKNKLKEALRNPKELNLDYFRSVLRVINLRFNTQKEWKEFDAHFDIVHRDFIKILKAQYPNLTNNDLRLCTLYRVNVSAREISETMAISLESLKKSRYRLRKKLSLNPDEDLSEFLKKIRPENKISC